MSQPLKVPALFLIGGLLAAGCGGEAESAADAQSDRVAVEAEADQPMGQDDAAPSTSPPPPAGAVGSPRTAPPTRPPATGGVTPPEREVVPVPEEESVIPPTPEPEAIVVPAGSRIHTLVESSISTRSHEAGETFHVRVIEDVLAVDGMVLVPMGATVEGRVIEARSSTDSNEEAALVLGFEALVIDGVRFPFHGTVVETQLETDAGDSGARSAAKVATGAAAGAILGQILGRDTRSTVSGAVVGAVAGAGVALTTREGHAVLQEGSTMIVQVDQPVVLTSG